MASWHSSQCSAGFVGQKLDVRSVPATFRPTQRHRLVTKMASKGTGGSAGIWLSLVDRGLTLRCAVTGMIKLALPAGKANPSPPVGPALGAKVTISEPRSALRQCSSAEQGLTLSSSAHRV